MAWSINGQTHAQYANFVHAQTEANLPRRGAKPTLTMFALAIRHAEVYRPEPSWARGNLVNTLAAF